MRAMIGAIPGVPVMPSIHKSPQSVAHAIGDYIESANDVLHTGMIDLIGDLLEQPLIYYVPGCTELICEAIKKLFPNAIISVIEVGEGCTFRGSLGYVDLRDFPIKAFELLLNSPNVWNPEDREE